MLLKSVLEYTNKLIYVEPFSGWGWSRLDSGGPILSQEEAAGPPPFHIVVDHFYNFRNELWGAVGKVEEPSHCLHGFHIVFYTRQDKNIDFTDNICQFNVQIGPEEPVQIELDAANDQDWPLWKIDGKPVFNGYAIIGINSEVIREYYKKLGVDF